MDLGVSVVIPTFNRCSLVTRTLDSLLTQTHKDFEVIVVDDGSVDRTKESVEPYVGRTIRYTRTPHRGTPFAWNLGVNEAREEFVFLSGDDVVVDSHCLSALAAALDRVDAKTFGAVAPRLVYTLNVHSSAVGNAGAYAHIEPWSGDVAGSFDVEAKEVVEVPILHGYSMIRKSAFLDVGGFDERTYTGNYWREETDLWLRFKRKGYKLYYQPKAKIYCQKSLTRGGQWSNVGEKRSLYEYYVVRNHRNYLKKFYGKERFFMLPTFIIRRMYEWLMQMHAHVQHH